MREIDIIKACSDLGVHKDGAELGPDAILEDNNLTDINEIYEIRKEKCKKDIDVNNKKKNIEYVNKFNSNLYKVVCKSIENENLPIILGGDHSIAIGSALASIKKHSNLGIIWIDSHSDYHTFETTVSGNIHGLPFAAITGQVKQGLTEFHDGNFYNPKNAVLIGARSIDYPGEYDNLKKAGITVFTTEDIKAKGMTNIMKNAIEIASKGTIGMHISIDIDVLDPREAPGVSVPEIEGIFEKDLNEGLEEIITNKEKVKSIDIVEYNPIYDKNEVTLEIAKRILNKAIKLK